MSLLIDTQLLVWAKIAPDRLPRAARSVMVENEASLWFSLATLWEVAIRAALRRPDFDVDPGALRDTLLVDGYAEVVIDARHCQAVASLPHHHRDPFDRMLVAQARVEGMTLLTTDAALAAYGPAVRVV